MFPRPLTALVTAVVILTSTTACANPLAPNPPTIAQAPGDETTGVKAGWLRELNLNQDQLQKIQQIRNRYRQELTQQRQAVQQLQQELRSMMTGKATATAIRQKYEQLETAKQQFATTRFNILLEVREVLTPAQRQQLGDRMQRQRGKLHRRFKGDLDGAI